MRRLFCASLIFILFVGNVIAAGLNHKNSGGGYGKDGANGTNGSNGANGAQGPSNKCYGGLASSLISAGTDYSTVEATTTVSGLIPYYVRAFDGSTTEYMRGSIILEPNLKLLSSATFYASVRAKTTASAKNVQLMFSSTATANLGELNRLVISTGADIVPLSATMHQWTIFSWSQTISNLGWGVSNIVDFGFSRAHDTSKLTSTELAGDLYWKDWKVCVDLQ